MGVQVLYDKKNINAERRALMHDSEFTDVLFHKVEIDNSFNLDTFYEMEADFNHIWIKLNLKHVVTKFPYVMRIRKLRNVEGSYYPTQRQLIVDVRTPHAFVHELGHLIDYQCNLNEKDGGRLSDFARFNACVEEATAQFNLYFTSKIFANRKYYLRRREIFARLFEMYIARKFGKLEIGISEDGNHKAIYPNNHAMNSVADSYFDWLFMQNTEKLNDYLEAVAKVKAE